jgi:hypothetical protein
MEAHVNAVATAILREAGVKRLMDVAHEVAMNRSAVRFPLRGSSGDFSTCTYQAIASMTQFRSLQSRC